MLQPVCIIEMHILPTIGLNQHSFSEGSILCFIPQSLFVLPILHHCLACTLWSSLYPWFLCTWVSLGMGHHVLSDWVKKAGVGGEGRMKLFCWFGYAG